MKGLTQSQFEKEVTRILRRLEMLRSAKRGEIELRKVQVREYWVERHKVSAHDRYIAPARGRVATKRTRRRAA